MPTEHLRNGLALLQELFDVRAAPRVALRICMQQCGHRQMKEPELLREDLAEHALVAVGGADHEDPCDLDCLALTGLTSLTSLMLAKATARRRLLPKIHSRSN